MCFHLKSFSECRLKFYEDKYHLNEGSKGMDLDQIKLTRHEKLNLILKLSAASESLCLFVSLNFQK